MQHATRARLLSFASFAALIAGATHAAPPSVRGAIVSGTAPAGFTALDASEADAKNAIDGGGFFVRAKGPRASAAALGASAMPGLPVDPSDPQICTAASSSTAQGTHARLDEATIVKLKLGNVCRATMTAADGKTRSRTFTWLLAPREKLGVQVVCSFKSGDTKSEDACASLAESIVKTAR